MKHQWEDPVGVVLSKMVTEINTIGEIVIIARTTSSIFLQKLKHLLRTFEYNTRKVLQNSYNKPNNF